MRIRDENVDLTVGPGARKEALDYANARFREKETTKRILIAAVTLFAIACGLGIIFAPEGREYVAWGVAPALYVLSLGAIGVSRFALKTPMATINAVDTSEETASPDTS
jgi:hypothetical protein